MRSATSSSTSLPEYRKRSVLSAFAPSRTSRSRKTSALTLDTVLCKETGIIRSIVSFTSVTQTLRLLATSQNFHMVDHADVFRNYKLPAVCHMNRACDGFKLFRAMVRTPNSQWLEWLDTSGVKELRMPRTITDKEMLSMFDDKRFSNLQTLNLKNCTYITGASLARVSTNLQSLNMSWCRNIGLSKVKFPNLISLKLNIYSSNYFKTDLGTVWSTLKLLDLSGCNGIHDDAMSKIAKQCSNLESLDLRGCRWIGDDSVKVVAKYCPKLQHLSIGSYYGNTDITDEAVFQIVRQCLNILSLDVRGCEELSDDSQWLAQELPFFQSNEQSQDLLRAWRKESSV